MKKINLTEELIQALLGGNKVSINNEIELYPPNYAEYNLTRKQFERLRSMIRAEEYEKFRQMFEQIR